MMLDWKRRKLRKRYADNLQCRYCGIILRLYGFVELSRSYSQVKSGRMRSSSSPRGRMLGMCVAEGGMGYLAEVICQSALTSPVFTMCSFNGCM
jgi:hypothetical protein